MRRVLLISAILPAITLPVLGVSLSSPGQTDPVVIDCRGDSVVMPRTFVFACADGNNYLDNLHWTSWRQGQAAATDTQTINDCTPTCVAGTFRSYPVNVIFWGSVAVAGHPSQRRYSMVTLRYPGRRPPAYRGATKVPGPKTVTDRLWDWTQPAS